MCTDWMISSGILVNTITAVSFCHILSFCRQKHKLQLWVALLLLNRGTELWQTFCHNQGSKLRLIRSPMRLTFSPRRLKILVYSPKWRYLHVSVTKYQDKFASLRHVNSPSSWDKFQICCTDMYLIRCLLNFAVFGVFCEFRGSAPPGNTRSPVPMSCVIYILQTGD